MKIYGHERVNIKPRYWSAKHENCPGEKNYCDLTQSYMHAPKRGQTILSIFLLSDILLQNYLSNMLCTTGRKEWKGLPDMNQNIGMDTSKSETVRYGIGTNEMVWYMYFNGTVNGALSHNYYHIHFVVNSHV